MIYNNLDKHDILDFLDKILNISDKYIFSDKKKFE